MKVHIDYHVEVEGHRYSVSHSLVGMELEARITDALVELLHRGQRVAVGLVFYESMAGHLRLSY